MEKYTNPPAFLMTVKDKKKNINNDRFIYSRTKLGQIRYATHGTLQDLKTLTFSLH